MITVIVNFKLPDRMTREEIISKFNHTAQKWSNNRDLIFPFNHWLLWLNTSSRACSSAWLERIPDKDEAGGSSPPRPTSATRVRGD